MHRKGGPGHDVNVDLDSDQLRMSKAQAGRSSSPVLNTASCQARRLAKLPSLLDFSKANLAELFSNDHIAEY